MSQPATTYQETSIRYGAINDAREHFDELLVREISARAFSSSEPLTVTEHLELLSAGEMLARYYRHPAHAHRALQAGANWAQVAAATGRDEAQARRDYRDWAEDEHRLWADCNGEFGIDPAEYAAAVARADMATEQ